METAGAGKRLEVMIAKFLELRLKSGPPHSKPFVAVGSSRPSDVLISSAHNCASSVRSS